jgi:hypothetical protein
MKSTSPVMRAAGALLVAGSLQLEGCAVFVSGESFINSQAKDAKWQLKGSSSKNIGACIAGSISACDAPAAIAVVPSNITPQLRTDVLNKIRGSYRVTKESIQQGHAMLAVLGKLDAPKPWPQSIMTAQTQEPLLAKYVPPQSLKPLRHASLDSFAIAAMKPESVADAWIEGAKHAETALSISSTGQEFYKIVFTSAASPVGESFTMSKSGFRDWLDSAKNATELDGWAALSAHYVNVLVVEAQGIKGEPTEADRQRLAVVAQEALAASLMEAYTIAYFNGGQIFSVTLDPNDLYNQAESAVKKAFPKADTDTIKRLAQSLVTQALGTKPGDDGLYHLLAKKTDGGFVTRGGASYVFPGINISIDPGGTTPVSISKIDLAQVGADLVRVWVEALGDAWAQVPGDPKSTGVAAKGLPLYDPTKTSVTLEQFGYVNDWANSVEGPVGSATGQLIRGISWVSLNNEALAKLIETGVGVAARKATEKIAWCVYACTNKPGTTARLDNVSSRTFSFTLVNSVEAK